MAGRALPRPGFQTMISLRERAKPLVLASLVLCTRRAARHVHLPSSILEALWGSGVGSQFPLATGVGEDGLLLRGRLEIPWGVVG